MEQRSLSSAACAQVVIPAPRASLCPPLARVTVRFVKKSQHMHCKILTANELLNERHV